MKTNPRLYTVTTYCHIYPNRAAAIKKKIRESLVEVKGIDKNGIIYYRNSNDK